MGGVCIAEEGVRAAFGDDRLPLAGDLVERLVPGDGLELAGTLGAGALQRRLDAFGRVHQVGVAVHLAAGKAGRVGMVGVTLDAHDLAVVDMGDERAHVGTIVRTDDSD